MSNVAGNLQQYVSKLQQPYASDGRWFSYQVGKLGAITVLRTSKRAAAVIDDILIAKSSLCSLGSTNERREKGRETPCGLGEQRASRIDHARERKETS